VYNRKLVPATPADGSIEDGWGYVMNRISLCATIIKFGDWKKDGVK
jgi:gamma-glutamylcyclotransferase (GGCT)/AIG2-like uncharacterized protein YtfP